LKAAASMAMKNLMSYYKPNSVCLHPNRSTWFWVILFLTSISRFSSFTLIFFFLSKNKEGTFSETQTPWHESGMIWDMHFDYARWSGDTQFLPTVTQALFHQSRGNAQWVESWEPFYLPWCLILSEHDFLASNFLGPNDQTEGQWNDDILWPSQVCRNFTSFLSSNHSLTIDRVTAAFLFSWFREVQQDSFYST
jgi:hypothetical protein